MKKLVLTLAVAASSLTFAQQFGAKAGMNVSSLSKDAGLSDQKSKIGFYAGVFANVPVSTNFSIQPELLYSQYGDKSEGTILGQKISFTNNYDYIVLPVMFQYNATPELYFEAGPELGLIVNANQKFKNETNNTSDATANAKEKLNSFNFGIGIGAGYYFTPSLGLTARYVAGVSDIAKKENNTSDIKLRNNTFQVGLAYKFK